MDGTDPASKRSLFPCRSCLGCSIGFPALYGTTGPLISALGLQNRDQTLQSVDAFFLGWLFPKGQLTLAIDQSTWIGPTSFAGRFLTEIFQVSYFSYYFWGFGLFSYSSNVGAPTKRTPSPGIGSNASTCAWVGGYLINFLGYLLVPAIGPQFVLKDQYAFSDFWIRFCSSDSKIHSPQQATVQDCFPKRTYRIKLDCRPGGPRVCSSVCPVCHRGSHLDHWSHALAPLPLGH